MSSSLVIATGGLSIPKIGATGFGYAVARQFGIDVLTPRPGLVPLTFDPALLARCKSLSGLSVDAEVRCARAGFAEDCSLPIAELAGRQFFRFRPTGKRVKNFRST